MWVGWVVLHVCSVFTQQTLCAHDPLLFFPFFSWYTANAAPREDLMTHNYSKNKEENWTEWKWRRIQETMWIPTASLSPATVCTAQCHSTGMSSFHWNRILLLFFSFLFRSSLLLSSSCSFSSPLNGRSILGSKTIRAHIPHQLISLTAVRLDASHQWSECKCRALHFFAFISLVAMNFCFHAICINLTSDYVGTGQAPFLLLLLLSGRRRRKVNEPLFSVSHLAQCSTFAWLVCRRRLRRVLF